MKLYLNDTSPFSRAVLAILGLVQPSALELEWVDPWQSPNNLKKVNPFCTIPVLELDDGTALVESLSICQYLCEAYQVDNLKALNLSEPSEMRVLGLAKTLMELSFRTAVLPRFTEVENELVGRGAKAIERCLAQIEEEPAFLLGLDSVQGSRAPCNLATLYLHVALDYVEYRHNAAFSDYAGPNIRAFLANSPFAPLLQAMTPEQLASKPKFSELILSPDVA